MRASFEQRLTSEYQLLSARLKQAADYVVANPVEIATRSLRSISKDADLAPATFSRLSRAIGYDSYEDLREMMRETLDSRQNSFSDRVGKLQEEHKEGQKDFLPEQLAACSRNLEILGDCIDAQVLEVAVEHLHKARQVLLVGGLGSTGIAEHMNYMASFIADNWYLAGRMGASLASGMVGLDKNDVVIIITKPPFARRSILAAKEASSRDAYVVVITDTHSCPALVFATAGFIVPTESPHFFSSYAATLVLTETIIAMLAGRAGSSARERIAEVEIRNRRLGEVWDG